MATATSADPNYLVPVITGSATVLAAIIGGFFAAVLKHRWDVKSDALKHQWEVDAEQGRLGREHNERRSEELKLAFNGYLSKRIEVETILSVGFGTADAATAWAAFQLLTTHFSQIRVALDDPMDIDLIKKDLEAFGDWAHEQMVRQAVIQSGSVQLSDRPAAPLDEPVRKLAKRLLDRLNNYTSDNA
jgi:hypothetical protein